MQLFEQEQNHRHKRCHTVKHCTRYEQLEDFTLNVYSSFKVIASIQQELLIVSLLRVYGFL